MNDFFDDIFDWIFVVGNHSKLILHHFVHKFHHIIFLNQGNIHFFLFQHLFLNQNLKHLSTHQAIFRCSFHKVIEFLCFLHGIFFLNEHFLLSQWFSFFWNFPLEARKECFLSNHFWYFFLNIFYFKCW